MSQGSDIPELFVLILNEILGYISDFDRKLIRPWTWHLALPLMYSFLWSKDNTHSALRLYIVRAWTWHYFPSGQILGLFRTTADHIRRFFTKSHLQSCYNAVISIRTRCLKWFLQSVSAAHAVLSAFNSFLWNDILSWSRVNCWHSEWLPNWSSKNWTRVWSQDHRMVHPQVMWWTWHIILRHQRITTRFTDLTHCVLLHCHEKFAKIILSWTRCIFAWLWWCVWSSRTHRYRSTFITNNVFRLILPWPRIKPCLRIIESIFISFCSSNDRLRRTSDYNFIVIIISTWTWLFTISGFRECGFTICKKAIIFTKGHWAFHILKHCFRPIWARSWALSASYTSCSFETHTIKRKLNYRSYEKPIDANAFDTG